MERAAVDCDRTTAPTRRSDENVAQWERRFEIPMLVLAALVIPSLLLDQPGVADPGHGSPIARSRAP